MSTSTRASASARKAPAKAAAKTSPKTATKPAAQALAKASTKAAAPSDATHTTTVSAPAATGAAKPGTKPTVKATRKTAASSKATTATAKPASTAAAKTATKAGVKASKGAAPRTSPSRQVLSGNVAPKAAAAPPAKAATPSKSAPTSARQGTAKSAARSAATKSEQQAKANAVAKAKALAPDLAARIGSTPKTQYRGNPDVFGRLVEDHDRHRALLAMIDETSGKSPERERLFKELVLEIKSHAAAEEQALWSTVMRHPETTDDARHAVGEHKEMDKMLADLAARDMAKPEWLKRFVAVRDEYLHHIREEEQEQFEAAEKILSKDDVRYMKTVFERRKKAEKASAKVEKKIRLKD